MSINHYSSDLPQTHWWSHYTAMDSSSSNHKPFISTHHVLPDNSTATFWLNPHHLHHTAAVPNNAVSIDLNNEDEEELVDEYLSASEQVEQGFPKERLFEKPLTPSDVGKLNRLVIPKQHAEKHFPLNGGDSGENGLLLGFEDEVGKSWRFRYSYWNSSQSYVLTKGWSRFVKEKRLDAGDIVIFSRHRVDTGHLFIGWRRRNSDNGVALPPANGGESGGWNRVFYSPQPYPSQYQGSSNSLPYQNDQGLHAGSVSVPQNKTTGSGNPKRLRLFGVNLECQAEESEPSTPVGSPISSHHHQYYSNHMDISFSGADVYRQG